MKEFFAYVIKNLVDKPDSVDVQIVEGKERTIVEVKVSPEDIGKVIGREGRTVKALRELALSVGMRFKRRVHLEVVE